MPIDPDTESYITFNPAETLPAGNFAILSVLDNGFVISDVMGNDLASVLPTVRPQRYLPGNGSHMKMVAYPGVGIHRIACQGVKIGRLI